MGQGVMPPGGGGQQQGQGQMQGNQPSPNPASFPPILQQMLQQSAQQAQTTPGVSPLSRQGMNMIAQGAMQSPQGPMPGMMPGQQGGNVPPMPDAAKLYQMIAQLKTNPQAAQMWNQAQGNIDPVTGQPT